MSLQLLCVICGLLIPEDRANRGAMTCNNDHGKELKRRKRSRRAGTSCRLCGRPLRKVKTERVLTEQGGIEIRPCAVGAQTEQ